MLRFYQLFVWQLLIVIVNCDNLLVNTKSGPVRGVEEKTFLHKKKYLSYKGIPYAKPPVGELRFRVPVPIEPWRKPLLANEFGNSCIVVAQSQFFPLNSTQSEDCLYLNIYTPVIGLEKEIAKKAVMFFIHGGAFTEGDGTNGFYGPDFMIEKDVVLITVNYRLGPWGFANFEEPGFTGNMGFKDQQLALEWIKRNIHNFGGDPDLITIFGESAGGAAVHLHTLSERSRKCIKRAIPMSGGAFTYFTHFAKNNHIQLIKEVFGLNANATGKDVLTYMKNASTELIVQKNPVFTLYFGIVALIWGAVVEDKRIAINPFIIQNPRETYETTKIDVDVFFGCTSAEYKVMLNPFDLFDWVEPMKNYSNVGVPFHGVTPECARFKKVQKLVRQFYFGTGEVTRISENVDKYVQMNSDTNFFYCTYEAVRIHSKRANTFFYLHDVQLKLNIVSANLPGLYGTSHAEDVLYFFRSKKYSYLYDDIVANQTDVANKKTLNAIHFITKMFTDFAKTGSPNFEKFEPGSPNCVHITNDGLRPIVGPKKDVVEFWDKINRILKPCIFNQF